MSSIIQLSVNKSHLLVDERISAIGYILHEYLHLSGKDTNYLFLSAYLKILIVAGFIAMKVEVNKVSELKYHL